MEQLKPMIPECLALDTFDNRWGFLALAVVQTRNLRPRGLPAFMGSDFVLTGYRIFVQYRTSYGKRLRGLYILRSETDKRKMALLGNIFTHYNYRTTDIQVQRAGDVMTIRSSKSALLVIAQEASEVQLPAHSPFQSWKEARRFAGPLPYTFTYNTSKREVLIIEGVRDHWMPKPVTVVEGHVGFIDSLCLQGATLANAFVIHDIPYWWKKGRIDKFTP